MKITGYELCFTALSRKPAINLGSIAVTATVCLGYYFLCNYVVSYVL